METIFYAIVAVLVLFRLFQVLGQNDGADNKKQPIITNPADADWTRATKPKSIEYSKPEIKTIVPFKYANFTIEFEKIRAFDKSFDLAYFADNTVIKSFEDILTAYYKKDISKIQPLVTENVYKIYAESINSLEEAKAIEIIRIIDPVIKAINIKDKIATIDVEICATIGKIAKNVKSTEEIWTFERNFDAKEPVWLLSAVNLAR